MEKEGQEEEKSRGGASGRLRKQAGSMCAPWTWLRNVQGLTLNANRCCLLRLWAHRQKWACGETEREKEEEGRGVWEPLGTMS